jgi:hypothetical protein
MFSKLSKGTLARAALTQNLPVYVQYSPPTTALESAENFAELEPQYAWQ